MNGTAAALAAAASTLILWRIAALAARRRELSIGTLPIGVLAVVACAASLAAPAGIHAPVVVAVAGAAVAGVIDARTGSIFDPLTATLAVSAFLLAAADGCAVGALAGAACVGATLLALHLVTRRRGIGLGDVKLGAALGVALGPWNGLAVIAIAFVFGGIYGAWLLVTKRSAFGAPIRFGPFIAAGTFSALLIPLWYRP